MQLIRCLLSNFYHNMFRASLCPSSGEQGRVLLHMVFCTGCAGCGCVELSPKLCAHSLGPNYTQPQPAQPVQNTICSNTRPCSPDDGHNDARNMLKHVGIEVCTQLTIHSTQPQPAQPVQNTICSNTQPCSPDDGHNDARNMLR